MTNMSAAHGTVRFRADTREHLLSLVSLLQTESEKHDFETSLSKYPVNPDSDLIVKDGIKGWMTTVYFDGCGWNEYATNVKSFPKWLAEKAKEADFTSYEWSTWFNYVDWGMDEGWLSEVSCFLVHPTGFPFEETVFKNLIEEEVDCTVKNLEKYDFQDFEDWVIGKIDNLTERDEAEEEFWDECEDEVLDYFDGNSKKAKKAVKEIFDSMDWEEA